MREHRSIPEIRFKSFEDDWKSFEFSSISPRVSSKSEVLDLPRLEYEDIISGAGQLNKNLKGKESTKVGLEFIEGDVLFGKLRPYLKNWLLPTFKGIAVGDFWVLRGNEGLGKFVYYLIQTSEFENVANQSTGTKMPRSDWNLISKTEFFIPKKTEQIQIGNFFQNLDQLISLHQKKYDKLVILKKAMLEKMFPKPGAKVPEIRFKGFEGEWEEKKVGEVANLLTGFPFQSKSFTKAGIKLIRGMNVKRGQLDISDPICEYWPSSNGLENYLLKENDIVIQMDGALIGKSYAMISNNDLPALLVQRVTRVRFEYGDFIYQWFQKGFLEYINSIKTETAVPHLSLNDVKDFAISLPSKQEQQKLGSYFKNLDNLISLNQKQLEKLKNIKKACLEKMFV